MELKKRLQKKFIIFFTNENKNSKLLDYRKNYYSANFCIRILSSWFYGDLIPFVLFLVASFTDFLDGLLARMFKEESKLGELLDPIADKIIVATALILLVMDGTIRNYEVIAAIIILTREILISGLREFLAKGQIKLPVSNLAKLKTFFKCFLLHFYLLVKLGIN